jgi:AhpC/TSA family/Copper type II ascorbate-dependent monooxygenase, C-terminal domain
MHKSMRGLVGLIAAVALSITLMGSGAVAPPATQPSDLGNAISEVSIRGLDLDGNIHSIGKVAVHPTALVFLGAECPISRRYVPVLNELLASANSKQVDLIGVISDPTVSLAAANQFRKDYAASFPIIFDASGELARKLNPAITPEAFVIDTHGSVLYCGRIDDQYDSVARQRQQPQHHDLADAILAVATCGTIAVTRTQAIGCVFESWDRQPASSKITYARNIAPIMYANCVTCHRAGEVAPFVLTGYEDAAKRAKQIAAVTESRFMPPWKAAEGYGQFLDERRLSDDEIATIRAWADAGAPEGNAADLPPMPEFPSGWQLGKPDLVLTMPEPFNVPAKGPDVYRAFVLPMNLPKDTFVSGFQFVAGASTVVHHSLLFLDSNGIARRLEAASIAAGKGAGYATFGGIGFLPTGGLGGWAPGATPFLLPPGSGRYVKGGSDLVMQIHYHPDGKAHADQSHVAIYLAKSRVDHIVVSVSLMDRRIDIQPGDSHFVKEASLTLPVDATIDGITPHMHLLGREMRVTATKPNGSVVPMIWIKDWDFRWQNQYRYAQPVKLPKGTRIDLHAVYDNSADNPANPNDPPKEVHFGEQTTDEMCICFLSIVSQTPGDLRAIRREIARERLMNSLGLGK